MTAGSTAPGAFLRADAVVEVDDDAVEPALIEQLQPQTNVIGKSLRAASDDDRDDEQVDLIDQPVLERGAARPGPPTLMSRSAAFM